MSPCRGGRARSSPNCVRLPVITGAISVLARRQADAERVPEQSPASGGYDTKHQHCTHGFRSTASTSLDGSKLFRPEVIERQLAHVKKDKVESKYNRAQYWSEREPMMLHWADKLDILRDGAEVVPLRRTA